MIEESLLKSNFIGRDGFRWWVGQIPPGESLGGQNKGKGWGNRFKVRILGYHPYSKADLPDEDLPWAGCLLPATSGTGASNLAQSVKYRPGDVVVGFFMDGDNAQIPMIMGAFGRTSQVPQDDPSEAFKAFTGYTSTSGIKGTTASIPKPDGTLDPDESNEQNRESQKSPRSISDKQAKKINSNNDGKEEIAASKADGQVISPANACDDTFMDEVTDVLENFLGGIPKNPLGGVIGEASDFLGDVNAVTKKIQRLANNPVSTMMDSLYREFIPLMRGGLNALYESVKNSTGTLAAIAAIKAMVPPMVAIQDQLACLTGKIIGGLGDTVKGMIEGALINIVNFGTCVAEQFAGDLLNKVTDQIVDGMSGVLKGIEPILEFVNVDVREILGKSADTIASAAGFFDCNQDKGKCTGKVRKWTLGYGADGSFDLQKTYDNVMDQINVQNALGLAGIKLPSLPDIGGLTSTLSGLGIDLPSLGVNIDDFANDLPGLQSTLSGLGVNLPELGVNISDFAGVGTNSAFTKPDCATPSACGGPTVKIFDGDGIGGVGRAILGGIVSNTSGLSDTIENVAKTASIIGVEITDPGSGYFYKEPLISFSDPCGLGYGAVAKAIMDFEKGEIKEIVILSEGENYPVAPRTVDPPDEDLESPLPPEIPVGILPDIIVENPGKDVPDPPIIVIDPPPNNPTDEPLFDVIVEDGRIISVTAINIIQVNTLPTLRVLGGTGAILRPVIGRIPESKPGQKIIQVIDCIT